jgi:enoyl-CoA hydratase/carnithine racemase
MQDERIIGRVGHVVFNNPAKLNAVSLDMWGRFTLC